MTRILTPEEARIFRNTLEETPGLEAIGQVIAGAIAAGNTILLDGFHVDYSNPAKNAKQEADNE